MRGKRKMGIYIYFFELGRQQARARTSELSADLRWIRLSRLCENCPGLVRMVVQTLSSLWQQKTAFLAANYKKN